MNAERIQVQVVLAMPEAAHIVNLEVPPGTTVLNAVERARVMERVESPTLGERCFGIFGVGCAPEALVVAGDRVEVYRPLTLEPKAQRRQRAARQRETD